MSKTPEDYLKEPYSRVLVPEAEGGYSAEILEFPGCYSQGDTADDAIANLEAAALGWIEAAQAQGQGIPPPAVNQGFGGKVALRLPRGTHRAAARMAEQEGCSLNQFLVAAISEKIGAVNAHGEMFRRIEHTISQLENRLTLQKAENRVERAIDLVNIIGGGQSSLGAFLTKAENSGALSTVGFNFRRTTGSTEGM